MATYLSLLRWTDQGIRNVKDTPTRIDNAKKAFQGAGAEMKAWYLAMGSYDMAVLTEAPDDETFAKIILGLGSLGNVRSETMRLFSEADFRNKLCPK
jgi:uncharacterized protein with GYD domain